MHTQILWFAIFNCHNFKCSNNVLMYTGKMNIRDFYIKMSVLEYVHK